MKTIYIEMYSRLKAIRDNLYLTEANLDEHWVSSKISSIEMLMDQLGAHIEECEPVDAIDELF